MVHSTQLASCKWSRGLSQGPVARLARGSWVVSTTQVQAGSSAGRWVEGEIGPLRPTAPHPREHLSRAGRQTLWLQSQQESLSSRGSGHQTQHRSLHWEGGAWDGTVREGLPWAGPTDSVLELVGPSSRPAITPHQTRGFTRGFTVSSPGMGAEVPGRAGPASPRPRSSAISPIFPWLSL